MAALDVDVEVAGEKKKMVLVSRDIGAGGIFLRTEQPAGLWKRVKLSITLPEGNRFEVGGEVVRTVPPDKIKVPGQPAGMAVAFDDVSRTKYKELLAVVLDLCARRPKDLTEPERLAAGVSPASTPAAPKQVKAAPKDSTDDLLAEMDELLDSVEAEAKTANIKPSSPTLVAARTPDRGPKPAPTPKTAPPPKKKVELETSRTARPLATDDLGSALRSYNQNLKGETYYAVLGVSPRADALQIEGAYQALLARFKPPNSPETLPADLVTQLSSVLGRIRKAFAILSKPDRKRAYDFLIDNEPGPESKSE
jgi:Tfp pilus assembly protein PilZ